MPTRSARLLEASRVRMGAAHRRPDRKPSGARLLEQIAAGELDVVIGTQAVVQDDVRVRRAGPGGRSTSSTSSASASGPRCKQAGVDPHYLVMTATPIPRTLGMTLFGDLDVSTLRELPPGRQTGATPIWSSRTSEARWWEFFRKKLREGRQALRHRAAGRRVGERRGRQRAASVRAARQRRAGGLPPRPGARPDDAGREAAGDGRFRSGETQVLVATTRRRSRRRRAQRHADDDRRRRAVRPGPAPPASRPRQPRQRIPATAASCRAETDDAARERLEAFAKTHRRLRAGRARLRAPRPRRPVRHAAARPAAAADRRPAARSRRAGRSPPRAQLLVADDPG